ncbi:MAG: HAMP domain-containing histidine kinase [Actinobacteria bacterium]|nr:MAG: HAMP domain-containing histidine kinase [Actinomycetota bacterium]
MVSRLPIRWRLAGTSAALTLVILCGFAVAVGTLTTRRIRSDFNHQIAAAADDLRDQIDVSVDDGRIAGIGPNLDLYASPGHAAIRVLTPDGTALAQTRTAPNLGPPYLGRTILFNGYRVETRQIPLRTGGAVYVQYARKVSDMEHTISRVRFFLLMGVLAGVALALLAGLMIARRAMTPIARLTAAARGIQRTRDATRRLPAPDAEDEVAELSHTLDEMLAALAASRAEVEQMLARQRSFVADASHELRTPLTSVLSNLELLAESLEGDQGEAARSALRSSRRMRRLVTDLLLLARADVGRTAERKPIDLAQVAIEAAAELGPVSQDHDLALEVEPAPLWGARDELHRVAINLIENALRHTPPGTQVCVRAGVLGPTRPGQRGEVFLEVSDEGPGIDAQLVPRLFERFVRGAGDHGGSFGIGLAIVRAVAEGHGGRVSLEPSDDGRGSRFVVRLPALAPGDSPVGAEDGAAAPGAPQPARAG